MTWQVTIAHGYIHAYMQPGASARAGTVGCRFVGALVLYSVPTFRSQMPRPFEKRPKSLGPETLSLQKRRCKLTPTLNPTGRTGKDLLRAGRDSKPLSALLFLGLGLDFMLQDLAQWIQNRVTVLANTCSLEV